jgi:taurine dioxygenase
LPRSVENRKMPFNSLKGRIFGFHIFKREFVEGYTTNLRRIKMIGLRGILNGSIPDLQKKIIEQSATSRVFRKKCAARRFSGNTIESIYFRSVRPIRCALGAEIKEIDLSQPSLDPKMRQVIKRALDEFSLVVFRGKSICGPEMVRNLSFLGPVAIEKNHVEQGLTLPGCPECFVLRNDENIPPSFDSWHSDKLSWAEPVKYTVLSCQNMPEIGGDILVSNNRKAFDSLSDAMKDILRKTRGIYNERNAFVNNPKMGEYLKKRGFDATGDYDKFQDQIHPLVRKNINNGEEALYFSSPYFSGIEGFSLQESKCFQEFLLRTIEKPEFVYRHVWQERDLIIIDNTATSHYAVYDCFSKIREFHRMLITGKNNE